MKGAWVFTTQFSLVLQKVRKRKLLYVNVGLDLSPLSVEVLGVVLVCCSQTPDVSGVQALEQDP